MTNEELAVMIQNGHTELYADLWEQVHKLICLKAKGYSFLCYQNGMRIDPEDIEDDLIQSGYFAVVEAVKYFDAESGFKFTTYLTNRLRSAFQQVLGIRTSKRDALDFSSSLDTPVGEDGDESLLSFIASPEDDMVRAEESVYMWELRAALDDALSILTDMQREIVRNYYFYGENYSDQAEKYGTSSQYICDLACTAIERIRRNRRIMNKLAEFMPDYNYDPYKFTGFSSWKQNELSVQDRVVLDLLL